MKGTLMKTDQGWMVNYDYSINKNDWETLPLHPEFIEMMDTCFTSNFSQEVEFEIVLCSHSKSKNDYYAKLIQKHQTFIDNRKDKLETLAKLLAKTWFYCDWKWESPNERVMQMLMQDLGLYPFKDEDEAIQQTQVDDELYKEASKRVPTYGKLSKDLVESKLDLSKIESKLDESLANETSESLTEWMNGKKEDDVEKLAEKYYGPGDYGLESKQGFIKGYNKAKETLYTEEQVREVIRNCFKSNSLGFLITEDDMMRTIKQPKKD
jgi:hypothetical protein